MKRTIHYKDNKQKKSNIRTRRGDSISAQGKQTADLDRKMKRDKWVSVIKELYEQGFSSEEIYKRYGSIIKSSLGGQTDARKMIEHFAPLKTVEEQPEKSDKTDHDDR